MRPPAVLLSVFLPIYHHHHRHHHHHRYPHHHHHCQHPLQWAFEIFTWPTPQYSKLILEVSTIFAKWIKQAAIWGYFFSCSRPACSPSFSHCRAIVMHCVPLWNHRHHVFTWCHFLSVTQCLLQSQNRRCSHQSWFWKFSHHIFVIMFYVIMSSS